MASFNINDAPRELEMTDFMSVSNDLGGLVKACRYAVLISQPRVALQTGNFGTSTGNGVLRDLTYLCEATEFPGRGFNTIDLRYYGPNFKVPAQTVYEDLNMTFICRAESYERQLFDDWMEAINPSQSFDFKYKDDYSTTITLYQYTEVATDQEQTVPKATYAFTLYEAFPVLVNAQPVTWADDGFQKLTVTFTYTKWRRKGYDPEPRQYSLVQGASVTR